MARSGKTIASTYCSSGPKSTEDVYDGRGEGIHGKRTERIGEHRTKIGRGRGKKEVKCTPSESKLREILALICVVRVRKVWKARVEHN